jgi:hypothetical protein
MQKCDTVTRWSPHGNAVQLRCDIHSRAKQGAPRWGQGLRRESVPAMRGGGHDADQRGALADRCSLGVLRDGQLAVKRGRGLSL